MEKKSPQGYENQHNKSSNSLIPNFRNSIYTVMLGNKRLLAQWEREINFLFGTNEKTNKDLQNSRTNNRRSRPKPTKEV